jgi:small-conductance mechanosensitive channel
MLGQCDNAFLGCSTAGADSRVAHIAAKMREIAVLTLVIGILIIVVIGAILFWVIDKFCPDARLAQLLKLLVVLVCLGAIVARLLPLLGYPSFM